MRKPKLKPPIIVIDSREQTPFTFEGFPTVVKGLRAGDYSMIGIEERCVVERKNFFDAWSCVAGERARFERCLARLAEYERAAIVIESSLREFAKRPAYIQRVTPATAVGSYISWSCQYNIPVFWADSHAYAERVTLRFLLAFMKHLAVPALPLADKEEATNEAERRC